LGKKLIHKLLFIYIALTCAACSLGGNLDELGDPLKGAYKGNPEIIMGIPIVGEILLANAGLPDGTAIQNYQWIRNGTTVIGSAPSYTVQFADAGYSIAVTVTGSGNSDSVTSAPVGPVPAPVVTITGNSDAGQTLTANAENLGGLVSFEWVRNGTDSIGTGDTYTLQTAESGSVITVTASVSGISGSVTSALFRASPYVNSTGISMVWIPAGIFMMGSPEDEPERSYDETLHQVTLSKSFYMSIYAITQGQYEAVMGINPSWFFLMPDSGEVQARRPVEMVSWYDAIEFCNELSGKEGLVPYYIIDKTAIDLNNLNDDDEDDPKWLITKNESSNGYRLPTEAEWEYACRAGTATMFSYGDSDMQTGDYAWYIDNSGSIPISHEAGKKLPNAWGLYDMHGNVWEWCWDWWGRSMYESGPKTDPQGPDMGMLRVLRGGCFYNPSFYLRSAFRTVLYPGDWNECIGFRVVRNGISD